MRRSRRIDGLKNLMLALTSLLVLIFGIKISIDTWWNKSHDELCLSETCVAASNSLFKNMDLTVS